MRKIGILNLTEHLDETVDGFKYGLEEADIGAEYVYFNAKGKESRLSGYAKKLLKESVDIVFACSTPSALALKHMMNGRGVPVIYAPVFNPFLAGLENPADEILKNFTGVSGMVASSLKLEMMDLLFQGLKHAMVLYDPDDRNSLFEHDALKNDAAARNIICTSLPLPGGEMSGPVMDQLSGPVLLAFSMKIEEGLEHWIDDAIERSVPVVASSKRGAVLGCLAGLYADHYQLGYSAALKTQEVLKGKTPSDIAVSYPEGCKVVCNYMTANRLDFQFPPEISMQGDIC